jgi:hypothetical protein
MPLELELARELAVYAQRCLRTAIDLRSGARPRDKTSALPATLMAESVRSSLVALALLKAEEVSDLKELPASFIELARQLEKGGIRVFQSFEVHFLASLDIVHEKGLAKVLIPDEILEKVFVETTMFAEQLTSESWQAVVEGGGSGRDG